MYLGLSLLWLAAAAWLIRHAIGQRGLLQGLAGASAADAACDGAVAVILPVRNEEANVEACLAGLLQQDYRGGRLQVLVIDDHSRDATAAIVARIAAQHPRVALLHSPVLPRGWYGKSHACWIGARAAPPDAAWLCFLDADVRAAPALLTRAVAAAQADGIDLLSLAPRLELRRFCERLVIPCGLYLLAFRQDLATLQARGSDSVTATGQFMLIRRELYEQAGGHAAVHGAVSEDVALAALMKRRGAHVVLRDGRDLLAAGMYSGWQALWFGLTKNIVDMLGGPRATLTTAIAGFVLAWASVLVPVFDATGCAAGQGSACVALLPALMASGAAFGLHLAGAVYFGIPVWYGLLFPLGYTVGAAMAADSLRRHRGGGVTWKGRTYPR